MDIKLQTIVLVSFCDIIYGQTDGLTRQQPSVLHIYIIMNIPKTIEKNCVPN